MSTDQVAERRALGEATVRELRDALRGELIAPGDAAYDEARAIWNGMIDRRPALVARCAGAADVIAALGFARGEGLEVAVRGGGHNVAGNATSNGGLVIDLGPMKGVSVDPDRRLVRAQGGVTWGELDAETQAFGLATTGGLVTTTGIAGFTLGGGIGWLMREHGLACDNLVSAEVVTADGRRLTASEDENPDLFWGLRGGGGNFGVVTEFEFRLHSVGPVLGGLVAWPTERAPEVLRFWRDWAAAAPDEVCTMAAFIYGPPEEFIPDELKGKPLLGIAVCHTDPNGTGEEAVRPLRELGPPIDVVGPMPYTALQGMFDDSAPRGMQNYWRSAYLAGLGDEAIDALLGAIAPSREATAGMPAPMSQVHLHQAGGAVAAVPDDATAYGQRDAAYVLNIVGMWPDPAENEGNVAWVRGISDAMAPHTTGRTYVNFLADEGAEGVRAAYEASTFERLQALKRDYDPTNLFRLNQNIPPG